MHRRPLGAGPSGSTSSNRCSCSATSPPALPWSSSCRAGDRHAGRHGRQPRRQRRRSPWHPTLRRHPPGSYNRSAAAKQHGAEHGAERGSTARGTVDGARRRRDPFSWASRCAPTSSTRAPDSGRLRRPRAPPRREGPSARPTPVCSCATACSRHRRPSGTTAGMRGATDGATAGGRPASGRPRATRRTDALGSAVARRRELPRGPREIDFMEIGDPDRQEVDVFLHYGEDNEQKHGRVKTDATRWHNRAVEWTPTSITTFLDGRKWYGTTDHAVQPPGPMHLCIQLDWFPSRKRYGAGVDDAGRLGTRVRPGRLTGRSLSAGSARWAYCRRGV